MVSWLFVRFRGGTVCFPPHLSLLPQGEESIHGEQQPQQIKQDQVLRCNILYRSIRFTGWLDDSGPSHSLRNKLETGLYQRHVALQDLPHFD